jgi:hypothetical protein
MSLPQFRHSNEKLESMFSYATASGFLLKFTPHLPALEVLNRGMRGRNDNFIIEQPLLCLPMYECFF